MTYKKYNLIASIDELQELDIYLINEKSCNFDLISIDTETNGLHFWKHVIIGLSFSTDSKSGFYIPCLIWEPDTTSLKKRKVKKIEYESYMQGHFRCPWTNEIYSENVSPKDFKQPEILKKYFKKWFFDSKVQIIMHNAPFDVLMIESNFGFDLSEQVFCDTALQKHVIDSSTSSALKETALLWQEELGIDAESQANKEQIEMGKSVILNGGTYNKKTKHIWRASLDVLYKYAIADTFLTMGVFEVGMQKLYDNFSEEQIDWFFGKEVMPLCREVVIPMKREGVRIDVPYFIEMEKETNEKLIELEDHIIDLLGSLLNDFPIGKSIDEVATRKALVEYIMKRECLEHPTKIVKGEVRKSLDKKAVKDAYDKTGHWLWAYLMGQTELPYNDIELAKIKKEVYREKEGQRYRFNIGSDLHMRWLMCKKLGHDPKTLPQTKSATKDKIIPSMKAEVFKQFFLDKYEFVKPLLLYKKLQKLHSTYILPALELHNNGYLHMDMMQNGTISGRFACAGGFNLQTLPKVEDLSKCPKCKSKNIVVVNPITIIAAIGCNDCGKETTDILCPSAIKAGFIAPEGYVIVNADYSSLEPRCFAFMSGDHKLKEIYWKNLDMYSKIYCDMEDPAGVYSPDPKAENFLKKLDISKRDMVKPVVLGIPYGARGPQVANLMKFKKTVLDRFTKEEKEVLDVEKGWDFRRKYLDTYPNLQKYMLKQELQAVTKGYVETLVGRRRRFKYTVSVMKLINKAGLTLDDFLDMKNKDLKTQQLNSVMTVNALKKLSEECGFDLIDKKSKIPRDWGFVRSMFKNELNNAKNLPIQGLGAHITNMAMLQFTRACKMKKIPARVCLQVHDEITTYSKSESKDIAVEVLRDTMENNEYAKLIDIPMIAEPIIANNLKEAK